MEGAPTVLMRTSAQSARQHNPDNQICSNWKIHLRYGDVSRHFVTVGKKIQNVLNV